MKLLLTSAGLRNKKITNVLLDLVGKPARKINVVFIPTAANYERGDKGWLIDDLSNFKKQNFKSIDIVDISALEKQDWEPAVRNADVIAVGGGNTFHLMHWINKSGLGRILPDLLKNKVYFGISAGSCVVGPKVLSKVQDFFAEEENKYKIEDGLGFVSFLILPHYNSPFLTNIREKNVRKKAKEEKYSMYAIDDQSAIKVVGDKVEIVSEGNYLILDKNE